MRLIDADELKKRVVKVMFRDTPESGEFYAVGTDDIDIMPTIDLDTLRPTAHWAGEYDGYADGNPVYDVWNCSACDYCIDDGTDDPEMLPKFCPNCGAKMIKMWRKEDELSMKEATIRDTMGHCLAKPGDRVRITKTHLADQYVACEGDTFVITKVVDDKIPYGRRLQPSGVLAASEQELDPNCCALIASEECGAPTSSTEPTTLRSVTIDVSDPKAAHKAVDDACAEYEDSQKIRWNNVVTESAKQNALSMMATLCEQGISVVWKICPQQNDRCVFLDSSCGSSDTSATAHNYPVDYAKTIFAKNAEFNEWIGRFVCLCKLMGKTPSDYIMRGIE